ncbi:MAG: hypothetical protein MJZ16_07180 [Bacteroidales bacterium]|nr:hypothetical protein [Bacteroidales bacterium]
MSILSEEQLKQQKEEARAREIRQNVKSHCTKIRDGIRKNGSTSGNRAIWELFQNAGDLAKDGSATIRITLTEDAFVFAHKGKSFTYDSLCSLVKQVSSQEKENDDTVGQYGTGFLTTHKFSRRIKVNGSMRISENPVAYVDVNDFLIDRENFDDISLFIEDMAAQIFNVEKLMDAEQKPYAKEWTELSYELNDQRREVAQAAIDEAIKLMPYVLTFNDNIGVCEIEDHTRSKFITFKKAEKNCSDSDLKCKSIVITESGFAPRNFDCYYLELHEGDSRIILPLKSENEVCSFGDVPRLFVHFPLIGPNHFGVNFLFHSHKFTPEEPRDNIIVPRDNDATDKAAAANKQILMEMTDTLWKYLEEHIHTWKDTIKMASINIKDSGYSEAKTEEYYKDLKTKWVEEFSKLKMIQIGENRYSMDDENHPLVLDSSLESFISNQKDEKKDYLSTIYPYAEKTATIPCKDELIRWSQIIAAWDDSKTGNFLGLETIVKYVSENQGEHLHDVLEMIVAAGHQEFFDKYALLPNREGTLMLRQNLRNAQSITKDLYDLVKKLDSTICTKFVDEGYADIVDLTAYSRTNLRDELNAVVKKHEDESWNNPSSPKAYDGAFEDSLIALCSAFTTVGGTSKRNKLMPIICKFEGKEYAEKHIPAWEDEAQGFDLYRNIFLSLVENQMKKIALKDLSWVSKNINDLVAFVDNARGDDYKNFCTAYAIYPDMNGDLHTPDTLKKNCVEFDELFNFYEQVLNEDLKGKCVDDCFESFYSNYSEPAYQYTSHSVAKDIQNKLSADGYQDTVLLDIIDLTESESDSGLQWRLLFKDIYDQRQSIRYNLGSDSERKAINKMLKMKSPTLMEKMADVAEMADANMVLNALNAVIDNIEHEAYIKKLGDFAESHIQRFLEESLEPLGVHVENIQGGQDFILSKEGFEDYHVEVKSRWESDQTVEMSALQFRRAVENPDSYALVGMNMYNFDRTRVDNDEHLELSELLPLIKVLDNIGELEADLRKRTAEAFKGGEHDIRLNGSYTVRVPQDIFKDNPMNFSELLTKLASYFS